MVRVRVRVMVRFRALIPNYSLRSIIRAFHEARWA